MSELILLIALSLALTLGTIYSVSWVIGRGFQDGRVASIRSRVKQLFRTIHRR